MNRFRRSALVEVTRIAKRPVLSALTFFATLGVLSVAYSAYTSVPANKTSGNPLSSAEWNNMANDLADHESRLTNLSWAVSTLQGVGMNVWAPVSGGVNYGGGNVGIGATNPGSRLEVAGRIKSSGRDPYWSSPCINQPTSINGYDLSSLTWGSAAWEVARYYGGHVTFYVYAWTNCSSYFYTVIPPVTLRDSPQYIYWNSAQFPSPVPGTSFQIFVH